MKSLTLLALFSLLSLSACKTTMELPDGQKLKTKDVCRNLSSKKCIPNVGKAKRLKKDAALLKIEGDDKDAILSYLGSVIRSDEKVLGATGGVCGGRTHTAFTKGDIVATRVKDANIYWEAFDNKRHWILPERLKADLRQGLKEAGVSNGTVLRLWSEINSTSKALRAQKLKTRSTFYQYQLKDNVLRELETARYGSRFKPCLTDLQSGGWRLYQAVTGFKVERQSFDEQSFDEILSRLAQNAVARDSDLDTVSIKENLSRTLTTRLNADVKPYFQPVGVSFWESRRFRVIG